MRVLVTGHHGYIGSVLAPVLQDAGHDVVGLDTFFYRGCDFGEAELSPALLRDVRDVTPSELEGFDAVVHLAALSNDPRGPQLRLDLGQPRRNDCVGARRQDRRRRAVRLRSSCSGGAVEGDAPVDEHAALRPLTPYAESKVRAEEALNELAGDGFSPVSMRNATAYGASPRLRLDIVLNNLVAWAHTTGAIKLLSDGSSWRPLFTSATSLAPPWPPRRPRRDTGGGRSTSAAPSRTTGFATWRRRSSGGCPTARSRSQKTPHPTHAATASTSRSSRRRSLTAASSGRRSEASTGSLTPIPGRT